MGRFTGFLSSLGTAPTSYFVYSAFSYYGSQRGWTLPGLWFVRSLKEAGRDEAAVRQTLYRMRMEGELTTERVGRSKVYRPTPYARAEIEAGTQKILDAADEGWDGRWTLVHVRLGGRERRVARKRVESVLQVEGFARVGRGVYVHPRPVGERLWRSLPDEVRPRVLIVRGTRVDGSGAELGGLWDVRELAARYATAGRRMGRLEKQLEAKPCTDREAFLLRFAVVFEYLGVAWDDPDLPVELVGEDWPGREARQGVARLYRRLLPGATRHADAVLAATTGEGPARTLG